MASFVVRCGVMRTLHVMQSRQVHKRGARVICRTGRGLELGEVLCDAEGAAVEQLIDPPGGSIQREATPEDEKELAHLAATLENETDRCMAVIRELNLEMDLIEIERIFGGERMVVYYLAEGRIDFRELVKRLAAEFQTRIEMKQVGVRDEAKLLADYGDCGKPLCCNTHLVEMPPVSMKMAKLQKATLDPNKISGRCGRLKCCLRYEYDTYEENRKTMPSVGTDIVTADGRARVIGQDLLTRQLVIAMEDNRRVIIATDQVLSVLRRSAATEPQDRDESERAESDRTADGNEESGKRRDESSPRSDRGGRRGPPQRERSNERNVDRNIDRNDAAKREQRIEDISSEDKNTERVADAAVPQNEAPLDEGTIEPKSE